MSSYEFQLEPYKRGNTRFDCPKCGAKKKFTRYIRIATNEYISPEVGRCERVNSCEYHYTPKQYFEDNKSIPKPRYNRNAIQTVKHVQTSYIDISFLKRSLRQYENNNLIQYLLRIFDVTQVEKLISQYYIGTANHWNGSTVFWQVDIAGRIRTGKIMLYSQFTGKRVKEPRNCIGWVHSALKLPEFALKQCFFGEHLLNGNNKPVAIVESEKTAIIASVYLPNFTWLAIGGVEGLNNDKCNVLQGRKVILYPDLQAYDKWDAKAKTISNLKGFSISDLLELKATEYERVQGLDIADYLLMFDSQKTNQQYEKQNETRSSNQGK